MGEPAMIGNFRLQKDKQLGKGTFGTVYQGEHKRTGAAVAIKKCEVGGQEKHGVIALREIKNFQHIVPHKHVVKMLDYSYENGAFWLVMEYCDRGDLEDYMKKYAPNIDKQMKIMHQCASAVGHMHALKEPIIHRDIKPANILFRTEGKSVVAKVADFGLSKVVDDTEVRLDTFLGTEFFMAPELHAKKKYNHTVDIFALGMVFLSMINFKSTDEHLLPLSASFLQNPEESLKSIGQEMHEADLRKSQQPIVINISLLDSDKMKKLKKLIIDMSSHNASQRTSMDQVVHEIEAIAVGSSSKSMVTGKITASQIFRSNLDITQTRGAFDPMSTMLCSDDGGEERDKTVVAEATMTPDSPKKKGGSSSADDEDVPDIGYVLMRQMIEDQVKKKEVKEKEKQKEETQKKEKQRESLSKALGLPLLQLLKLLDSDSDKTSKFEIGERVVVDDNLDRVKSKQDGHGGFHKMMDRYIGEEGTVKKILKSDIVEVMHDDGHKITWNTDVLELTHVHPSGKGARGTMKKSTFQLNDVVTIKVNAKELERLQNKGNTGWKDKMKKAIGIQGVVHRIHFDGDVLVEFMNHDKFWLNPDALDVVDMSKKEIEAGDQVIILDDKRKVKELQKGHGEWVDSMVKCLGRSGIVRKVSSTKAIVEVEETKLIWNLACLKLIVKSEDMLLLMLKRKFLES